MFHPQLTLPLGNAASSSFESYVPGLANAHAAASVRSFCADESGEQQLLLWGASAVGKTHLLSAACQEMATRGFQVAYLTGDLANREDALASIENVELFCLDDLQALAPSSEAALFHCINRCRESGTRLLFASKPSIDELPLSLPDLKTRLSWGAVFHLQSLADDELPEVLMQLLRLRGLDVNDDVVDYILRRYPRNMHALRDLVDALDQASMVEKRRVTIPLVRGLRTPT